MNRLKKLFLNLWEKIKDVIKNFPITMIIIAILTIISAVIIDNNYPDFIQDIIIIGAILGVGALFSETVFDKNRMFKYLSIIITLGIAVLFDQTENIIKNFNNEMYYRCLATYIITLGSVILYTFSKKSELDIKKYLFNIVSENFILGITYGILNAGVAAVSGIFIALILNSASDFVLVIRLLVLLCGFFYIPSVISILSNPKTKENSFVEKLMLFVAFPLALIAIVIIYIYIAKILLLREMPKNMVGRILIGIYLAVFPIWAMVVSINNEKVNKIAKKIPYFYMPLILLEIYSIFTRINQYGLTPIRYLGVLFIAFQLISFISIIMKEKCLREIILLIPIISIIYFVSPFNYEIVSLNSQKNILNIYIKSNESYEKYSEKDRKKIYGAYNYLLREDRKYIEKNMTEYQRNELNQNNEFFNGYSKNVFVKNQLGYINVSGFSKLYNAESSNYESINVKQLKIEYNKKEIYADLSSIIEDIIELNDNEDPNLDNYLTELSGIAIDDNHYLYIDNISFEYDFYDKTENMRYLSIGGYILEK